MMYGVMAIRFFDDVDFVFVVFLRATRVLNLRSRCFFVTDVHLLLIHDHAFLPLRL
jgi:hypothetical protein